MSGPVLELSAFLELRALGGGHDPAVLTAQHMHQFAADQRQREHDGLPSLGFRGRGGKPSIVTASTRQVVLHCTRRLFREALESGEAERLGLDRAFLTAMPQPGTVIRRARHPFPDGVARALADDANLSRLAAVYDPCDRGLRDAWETIIVTGRRCGEVLGLRLDCLGRYGGLPMLWHDQTKVGNYGTAIRIPERVYQLLEARRHTTITLFTIRTTGRPAPASVPGWRYSPPTGATPTAAGPCPTSGSTRASNGGSTTWISAGGFPSGKAFPGHQLAAGRGVADPYPPLPRPGVGEDGRALRAPDPDRP